MLTSRYGEVYPLYRIPLVSITDSHDSIAVCMNCAWWVHGAGSREGAVDELAFDLLIPRLILQRYVNLLLDHRRVILSGSTGTGKTYLARRLAEFIVERYV